MPKKEFQNGRHMRDLCEKKFHHEFRYSRKSYTCVYPREIGWWCSVEFNDVNGSINPIWTQKDTFSKRGTKKRVQDNSLQLFKWQKRKWIMVNYSFFAALRRRPFHPSHLSLSPSKNLHTTKIPVQSHTDRFKSARSSYFFSVAPFLFILF